ncbi:MAG: type III pantothenate kinase [bacterium]
MILSCDIGNSSSSFGLFEEKGYEVIKGFRIDTAKISSLQDLKKYISKNIDLKDVKAVSISSVTPSANPLYKEFFAKVKLEPFLISTDAKLNIRICIENSGKLGTDRIANISYAHFSNSKFQIVVDLGTALTIDVVNKNGDFLGGIIYPGLSTLAGSLYEYTEKLPLVKIAKPKTLIGTNTESAILSGIYHGILFLIKGFVDNICDYYNIYGTENLSVIFTGGQSSLVFDEIYVNAEKILDEHCTLKGIKYLYDINIT